MKAARILLLNLTLLATTIAVADPDSARTRFEQAYSELQDMLEGSRTMSFERAIYVSEAAYLDDTVGYDDFRSTLDAYQYYIGQLAQANDGSDTMDFRVLVPRTGRLDIRTLKHTEGEKRVFYHNVLHNWAIFTFLTDTTRFWGFEHLPFSYQYGDPFGMKDWRNSQVTNLLFGEERKGNCFALVALYKILADRLHSEAYICTAPQHIYIQHQDHKGDWYNVEMATGTHPGDGSIKTLTYTWNEGITSGIAMRRLKEEKQNIALCLVNLGMSHQHKFAKQGDAFALQCADLALKHDPKNLNAMLLRQQVLEEQVAERAVGKSITQVEQLRKDPATAFAFQQLEAQVVQLNTLGYHPMPHYMQEIILAELEQSDRGPLITKNRTPDPFPSLKNTAPGDKRYSTLSLGRFEEVHVQKRFEAYGRATLDTKEGHITAFSAEAPEELLIDPVAFAWSIDPLAHKFPGWSPYNFVLGNPVRLVDPDGRAPDDIHLDEDGKVAVVVKTDQPNRFFDNEGTEITPHDKGGADSPLMTHHFEVGDQVLFNVSKKTYATGLLNAGIGPFVSKVLNQPVERLLRTAWGSYNKADFGVGFLASEFTTKGSSTSGGVIRGGYPEESGYFRFEGTNEMYNLYDAGNHMWGSWMGLNGYSLEDSQKAANWNSLLSGQGNDTPADQGAIANGYNFSLQ